MLCTLWARLRRAVFATAGILQTLSLATIKPETIVALETHRRLVLCAHQLQLHIHARASFGSAVLARAAVPRALGVIVVEVETWQAFGALGLAISWTGVIDSSGAAFTVTSLRASGFGLIHSETRVTL